MQSLERLKALTLDLTKRSQINHHLSRTRTRANSADHPRRACLSSIPPRAPPMAASGRYGLRQRHHQSAPAKGDSGTDDETVQALGFVGLKPKVLSKRERQLFGGVAPDYTSVR